MENKPQRPANDQSAPNDKRPVWHQQRNKGETDRNYGLFQYFLSLEPAERTLTKVAENFDIDLGYVSKLSIARNWLERAAAHTDWIAQQTDAAARRAAEQMALDWADWEYENLNRVRGITERLLANCEKMLNQPIQEMTKKTAPIKDKFGKAVVVDGEQVYAEITTIKPVRHTAADAPRYAEAAVILTKYLKDQNSPSVEPIRAPLPAPKKPVEEMTVEERDEYIAELRRAQAENAARLQDYGEQG